MSILEFLAGFDWITPTRAIAQTVARGMGHAFYIDLDSGWSGAECESLLDAVGIEVYGQCTANGDAFWQVAKEQAEQAERILLQAGVPLKYHLFSERNVKYL